MASNNKTGIPSIKTFQIDSDGIGNLKKSVNLFRGDVNFTQSLISLPGPQGKKELDIDISIFYQSNIEQEASKWNLDSPTGILGLGWNMPTEKITVDNNGSPTKETNVYYLESGGSKDQLIRDLSDPLLTTLDGKFETYLKGTSELRTVLHTGLVNKGVLISPGTEVTKIDNNSWKLSDKSCQRTYKVRIKNKILEIYDGGQSYQLQGYQFWRIIYYPDFERWEITKESGARYSYGGIGKTVNGLKTSTGNSIEWSVCWITDNGTDKALWTGNSSLTNTGSLVQGQYASAWNLTAIQDIWGEKISYAYNETNVQGTVETGLCNDDFEQQVGGNDGLAYTKACYLTSITDAFSRKVIFSYNEKIYDNSSPEAPKEYQDPHKETPDSTPNAYQDKYETKYLEQISVNNKNNKLLFYLKFDYCPGTGSGAPDCAVANITNYTGLQYGCTFKRYLTSITQYNAANDCLPGMNFDYYLDVDTDSNNPGALKSITYPEGGVAVYSYSQHSLDVCNRRQAICPPEEITAQGPAAPRVWFGNDYTVSVWYNYTTGQVSMQVYTWIGHWECWQLSSDTSIITTDKGIDIATMNVVAGENYFALYFQEDDNTEFYLFQKDTAKSGQWFQSGTSDNTVQTYNCPAQHLTVTGGDSFMLVLEEQNQDTSLIRYTYNWYTQLWVAENVIENNPSKVFVTANAEYYATLVLDEDEGTAQITLSYLDPQLNWNTAPPFDLDDFSMADTDKFAMAAGQSIIACSRSLSNRTSPTINYAVTILQWDEEYVILNDYFEQEFTDNVPKGGSPASTVPQVIENSLVCCAGHLMRFNGNAWLVNSQLVPEDPLTNSAQRYSYGSDYALQATYQKGNSLGTAGLLQFDPDMHSLAWEDGALIDLPQLTYSGINADEENFPSAGTGYFLSGQTIYYMGNSSNWNDKTEIGSIGISSDEGWVNTDAIINATPDYLTYVQNYNEQSSSPSTVTILFKNGEIQSNAEIPGEKYYTSDEGGAGQGLSPAGNGCFVTYPSSAETFVNAPEIYLYRYAGNSFEGNIEHYAVTNLSINDGFGQVHNFVFDYDLASAACDPSGEVVKYYKAMVYPGCESIENSQYGYILYEYINGLNEGSEADFYDMLDGNLLSTTAYDSNGNNIASKSYTWHVYKEKALYPHAENRVYLYGGIVYQSSETITKNGIASTTTYNYAEKESGVPYSGEMISSQKTNYNSEGIEETITQVKIYGYEKYPYLNVRHMLEIEAQMIEEIAQGDNPAVVKKATAKTIKYWPATIDGYSTLVPAVNVSFAYLGGDIGPDFPYTGYIDGSSAPDGWSCRHLIAERGKNGQILKSTSAKKLTSLHIYDTYQHLKTAHFTTPDSGNYECCYLGFEPYEDISLWEMGTGACIVSGDSTTGSQSLQLNTGGTLGTSISIDNLQEDYVLGFYLKTPVSFSSENSSGWYISIDTLDKPFFCPFENTGGSWKYFSVPVQFSKLDIESDNIQVGFRAENQSSVAILVDNIHINPLRSDFNAIVYNEDLNTEKSLMATGGKIICYIHDYFGNKVIQTNYTGNIDNLTCDFLSRQGNGDDVFDPDAPNCNVSVHPSQGGRCDTFTTGDEWQLSWKASEISNWEVSDGSLKHIMNVDDTLTLIADLQPEDGIDIAGLGIYFEVGALQNPPDDNFGVHLGGNILLEWSTSGSAWQLTKDGTVLALPLANPPHMAKIWFVFMVNKTILFYGDGQLIFSCQLGNAIDYTFEISTGKNLLDIRNLSFMTGPQINAVFNDATGKQYQEHSYTDSDSVIKQTIYDNLGRHTVLTKPAPASFGNAGKKETMQFRDTFVHVGDFLSTLGSTGIMSGDVADYYRGQQDGNNVRSDDEGYPYYRMRYNNSPLKHIVEFGLPGAGCAIKDLDKTTMDQRQTVQLRYNGVSDIAYNGNIISGSYYTETLIEPLKAQTTVIKDLEGENIGHLKFGSDPSADKNPLSCTLSVTEYNSSGKTETKKLPNYFSDDTQNNPSGFTRQSVYNMLGKVIQSSDANTGTTKHIYDSAGNLRFTCPEQDNTKEDPYILYNNYDSLNRKTESGKCLCAWNEGELAGYADDPVWPHGSSNTFYPAVQNIYDGDGSDPDAIGQIVSTITLNYNVPDSVISEDYLYNALGKMKKKTLTVPSGGDNPATYEISYLYNNSGQVTQIIYPSVVNEEGQMTVTYAYDGLGRVGSVTGEAGTDPVRYASYSYDAGDNICQTRIDGDIIGGVFNFNSPGWHINTDYSTAEQGIFGFHQEYGFDQDGRIIQIETSGSGQNTLSETFGYDDLKRLKQYILSNGDKSAQSKEIDFAQYDANGNLQCVEGGGESLVFDMSPGKDQISSVSYQAQNKTIGYYPSGEISSTPAPYSSNGEVLNYTYDKVQDRTCTISKSESRETVELIYGSQGRRLKKQGQGNSFVVYIHGNNLEPLAELTQDGTACLYIYGPTGLIAFRKNSSDYFLIKDQNGSVRSVLDSTGALVAGYNYLPFGNLLNSYGPDTSVTRYLYTGQEFDGETGLYNYHARLYNPALKRFNSQDPARQYPSPYTYVGNNPVMNTDPTGDISQDAQIGIAVGMGVLTVATIAASIALSVLTLGAATPVAATADTVVIGGETAAATGVASAEAVAEIGAESATEKIAKMAEKLAKMAGKLAKKAGTKSLNMMLGAVIGSSSDAVGQAITDPHNIKPKSIIMGGLLGALGGGAFEFANFRRGMERKEATKLVSRLLVLVTGTITLGSFSALIDSLTSSGDEPNDENDNSSSSNTPSPSAIQNRQIQYKPVKSAHLRKHLHGGHKKLKMLGGHK